MDMNDTSNCTVFTEFISGAQYICEKEQFHQSCLWSEVWSRIEWWRNMFKWITVVFPVCLMISRWHDPRSCVLHLQLLLSSSERHVLPPWALHLDAAWRVLILSWAAVTVVIYRLKSAVFWACLSCPFLTKSHFGGNCLLDLGLFIQYDMYRLNIKYSSLSSEYLILTWQAKNNVPDLAFSISVCY